MASLMTVSSRHAGSCLMATAGRSTVSRRMLSSPRERSRSIACSTADTTLNLGAHQPRTFASSPDAPDKRPHDRGPPSPRSQSASRAPELTLTGKPLPRTRPVDPSSPHLPLGFTFRPSDFDSLHASGRAPGRSRLSVPPIRPPPSLTSGAPRQARPLPSSRTSAPPTVPHPPREPEPVEQEQVVAIPIESIPQQTSSPAEPAEEDLASDTLALLGRFSSANVGSLSVTSRRPTPLPRRMEPAPQHQQLDVDAIEYPNGFSPSTLALDPAPATIAFPSVLSGAETTSTYILGRQESRFFHEIRRSEREGVRYPFFEGGEIGTGELDEASPWSALTPAHPEKHSDYLTDRNRLGLLATESDLKVTVKPWTIAVSSPSGVHEIPPKTTVPIAWLLDSEPSLVDPVTGRKQLSWQAPSATSFVVTPEAGPAAEDDVLKIESSPEGSANLPLSFIAQQVSRRAQKPSPPSFLAQALSLLSKSSSSRSDRSSPHRAAVRSGLLERTPSYDWEHLTQAETNVSRAKEELESKGMITVRFGSELGAGDETVQQLVSLFDGKSREEPVPAADYSSDRPLVEMELCHLPDPPTYQIVAPDVALDSSHQAPWTFIDTFEAASAIFDLQPQTFAALASASLTHRSPPDPTGPSSSSTTGSFFSSLSIPSISRPIISLSLESSRVINMYAKIGHHGSTSTLRPQPEIVSVNYSPSWRDVVPLTKNAGVVVAGLRLMQRLMVGREEARRGWMPQEGEVTVFRRDRWVLERAKTAEQDAKRKTWLMDM